MRLTPYQRVADALLRTQGTTLAIVVLDADDAGKSAHSIARELHERTDGAVDVTAQAVRNWVDQFREHSDETSAVGGAV